MATVRPFRALRPRQDLVSRVAALPYDVMNEAEAREMTDAEPYSFLHIDRAECDLPDGTDPYSQEVYEKAASTLRAWTEQGIFIRDTAPCFYLYRLTMDGREQTGLVACCAASDYEDNHIKKHELTRAEKEADRIRHVDTCNANTGPIFLCFRESEALRRIMEAECRKDPVYDFVSDDGIGHTVWLVSDPQRVEELRKAAEEAGDLYIADGHHRCASAIAVAKKRREEKGYSENAESEYFLAVLFPDSDLRIFDYNRLVKDLCGLTEDAFLTVVSDSFDITLRDKPIHPEGKGHFGMYLHGKWYSLEIRKDLTEGLSGADELDVTLLQNHLLSPILGIGDPRNDPRIAFVGGIRGLGALEKAVDSGEAAVAFSMFPTSVAELMAIADAGEIMPPKSTWFEPKLRSGLFIHELEE